MLSEEMINIWMGGTHEKSENNNQQKNAPHIE